MRKLLLISVVAIAGYGQLITNPQFPPASGGGVGGATNLVNANAVTCVASAGVITECAAAPNTMTGTLTISHTGAQGATAVIIKRSDNVTANGALRAQGSGGAFSWGIAAAFNISSTRFEIINGTTTYLANLSNGLFSQFGGSGASAPCMKQSSTTNAFRLCDDSADSPITASTANFSGAVSLGSGVTGTVATLGSGANADTTISVASARATFGYDGVGAYFKGGSGKALSLTGNANGLPALVLARDSALVGVGGSISDTSTMAGATVIFGSSLTSFGGTSASFPALKRSSTTLAVRLADDSADAPISASTANFSDTVTLANNKLYTWNGRSYMESGADGRWTAHPNAGSSGLSMQLKLPAIAAGFGSGAAIIATSTDSNGQITLGTTSGTSGTINFAQTWAVSPFCMAEMVDSTTPIAIGATASTTVLTLAGVFVDGKKITWHCFSGT